MQRVRIGLTGLACVFLLVLLAAAFFGIARHEADLNAPPAAAAAASKQAAVADEPKDPLAELVKIDPASIVAELGVAPGNVPDESANNSAPAEGR